jgi:hypothetical protein
MSNVQRQGAKSRLDPENSDLAGLTGMLQPYSAEQMAYRAYDRYVSSSRNKEKSLIIPVGEKIRMG